MPHSFRRSIYVIQSPPQPLDTSPIDEAKRARRQFFEQFSRDMVKAVQELGLTEDEWMAELEKDKEAVYQEYYGDKS